MTISPDKEVMIVTKCGAATEVMEIEMTLLITPREQTIPEKVEWIDLTGTIEVEAGTEESKDLIGMEDTEESIDPIGPTDLIGLIGLATVDAVNLRKAPV